MSKEEKEVHVIEMTSFTKRDFTEKVSTAGYVKHEAKVDDYPDYIEEMFNESVLHGTLCKSISDMIYGAGLVYEDESEIEDKEYLEWLEQKEFGVRGKDTLRKMILDLKVYGGAILEIIRRQGGGYAIRCAEYSEWRSGVQNSDGEVESMFWSLDWVRSRKERIEVPMWTPGTTADRSVMFIQLPKLGTKYYAKPDYWSGMMSIEMDREISSFHLNGILNGLVPSMAISMNNGEIDDPKKGKALRKQIQDGMQGTKNTGKFFLTSADSKENAMTVDVLETSNIDKQYESMDERIMQKVLTAHRATSGIIFGIKDNTGFGNNADEMLIAQGLFERNVVSGFRDIAEGDVNPLFKEVFNLKKPVKFISEDFEALTQGTEKRVEDVVKEDLSSNQLTSEESSELLGALAKYGETVDEDEWILVSQRQHSEDNDSPEDWARRMIRPLETKMADIVKSFPNKHSYLDKSIYKVRWQYIEVHASKNHRDFCFEMMNRTENGVVYRLEDIDKASREGVNRRFGHKGEPYNLFKWKGGPHCGHIWIANLFRLKQKTDGTFVPDKSLASSEEVDSIPKSYMPKPRGMKEAGIAPKDMKNNGHHPNYKG